MKAQRKKEDYIIATKVLNSTHKEEFVVEVYPYSLELDCEGTPSRTINNFDDLINFFDELDEPEVQ